MQEDRRPVHIEDNNMAYDYEKNPPVGIDLGTSNSAVARWVNTVKITGSHAYYLNSQSGHVMPSTAYLQEEDGKKEFLVGKIARKMRVSDPLRVAAAFKREIGDTARKIRMGNEMVSSVELSAEILKGLFISVLETVPEFDPSGLVVAVPYYFTQVQNDNTVSALEAAFKDLAGKGGGNLKNRFLGLIPEPVAAALSYSLEHIHTPMDQIILAVDMGGGTLDLTIFELSITGSEINFEVLGTDGSANFGGEDFDEILGAYIVDREGVTDDNLSPKLIARQNLMIRENVMEAKEKLSANKVVDLMVSGLPCGVLLDTRIKRREFETLLGGRNILRRDFGAEFEECLQKVLQKAGLHRESTVTVLPIGGSCRIPFFRDRINAVLRNARNLQITDSEYDSLFLSVAKGAAIYAAYLLDKKNGRSHLNFDKRVNFLTRTSHGLAIKTARGDMSVVVPENSIVPATKRKVYVPLPKYGDRGKTSIEIPDIEVYQVGSRDEDPRVLIGKIKMPEVYTHDRKNGDIKVEVAFNVDVTRLNISIKIDGSDEDKGTIMVEESVELERENSK